MEDSMARNRSPGLFQHCIITVVMSIVCIACISGRVSAQCVTGWLSGQGAALDVSGLPDATDVNATAVWDPDGAGPLPSRLVAGGFFSIAGNIPAENIASWDGTTWHPFGTGTNGAVHALAVL